MFKDSVSIYAPGTGALKTRVAAVVAELPNTGIVITSARKSPYSDNWPGLATLVFVAETDAQRAAFRTASLATMPKALGGQA